MEVFGRSYYRARMRFFRSSLFVCLIALGSGFTGPSAMASQFSNDLANDSYTDFSDGQVENESSDFHPLVFPHLKPDISSHRAGFSEALAVGDFIVDTTHPMHHRGNTKEPPTALQS